MTNINPVFYDTLIKKIKIIRFCFLLGALFVIAFLFFLTYLDISEKKAVFLCVMLLASFLYIEKFLSHRFSKNILKQIKLAHNWGYDKNLKNDSWNFMADLKKFQLCADNAEYAFTKNLFYGNYSNRNFAFYSLTIPFRKNETSDYLLIKTDPLPNFDKVILIKPMGEYIDESSAENKLQEIGVNTKGLFLVYTTDAQNSAEFLSQEFKNALVEYAEKTDKTISILLTPQGILCAKNFDYKEKPSLLFSSAEKYVAKYWQSTDNFIRLLDIINLLERE